MQRAPNQMGRSHCEVTTCQSFDTMLLRPPVQYSTVRHKYCAVLPAITLAPLLLCPCVLLCRQGQGDDHGRLVEHPLAQEARAPSLRQSPPAYQQQHSASMAPLNGSDVLPQENGGFLLRPPPPRPPPRLPPPPLLRRIRGVVRSRNSYDVPFPRIPSQHDPIFTKVVYQWDRGESCNPLHYWSPHLSGYQLLETSLWGQQSGSVKSLQQDRAHAPRSCLRRRKRS